MGRLLRQFESGIPAHLVLRGNNRQVVFRDALDFGHFRHALVEATRRYGVEVHAYVLMGNHAHLLVTPLSGDSISRAIQLAARRHSGYFNDRYGRTGTIWEGRYHASIVESERYYFTCHRYIELNPVRAAMVEHARDYTWSSHRAHAEGAPDDLVTPHALYLALADTVAGRRKAFRESFGACDDGTAKLIREAWHSGVPLGSPQFLAHHMARMGKSYPPRSPGRPRQQLVSDTN